MKLLAWMHRKFHQGNGIAVEDAGITGNSRHEQQKCCLKQSCVGRLRGERRNNFNKKPLANSWGEEEEEENEESGGVFDGFLAIGTLGSDAATMPPTPTFTVAAAKAAERETPATESEQKLVFHEKEKAGGAEIAESDQGNPPAMKQARKSSLGELFQKTPLEGKNCSKKEDGRSHGKNVAKEIAKKNKKKTRPSSCAGDDDGTTGKLNKILQIFRKKVHPERLECACTKKGKASGNKNARAHRGGGGGGQVISIGAATAIPGKTFRKMEKKPHRARSRPPDTQLDSCDSTTSKEYWIKTDSEYLVLEL